MLGLDMNLCSEAHCFLQLVFRATMANRTKGVEHSLNTAFGRHSALAGVEGAV